jgi:hypothetical protein
MTMDISNQNKLSEFYEELKRLILKLLDQILMNVLLILEQKEINFIMH